MEIGYLTQDVLKLKLPVLANEVVEGFVTGLHKSPFHGFSVEFAEHRLYNQGDPLRDVDWKLYARTEKRFIKRYEEETNLRCQIVLDASSSMNFPQTGTSKLMFSVLGAAALIELLARQKDASGITIFRETTELSTATGTTAGHRKYLMQELEKVLVSGAPNRSTHLSHCLHSLAESLHRRSMIIIFSDLIESEGKTGDILSSLRHLRHNKHEVIVFHVSDYALEAGLTYDPRPTRFIDLETGRQIKVNPLEIREAYREKYSAFVGEIQMQCAQNRIDYFRADTALGLYPVLRAWLLKRNRA